MDVEFVNFSGDYASFEIKRNMYQQIEFKMAK